MLDVVEPIVLTAPAPTAIKLGRSFVLTIAARGGLAPYRWSSTSLPAGVNVNPATGQVGGRPQTVGTLPLVLTATDGRAGPPPSGSAPIVGAMPVATTIWSFVFLAIVIAVPVWLVLKFSNRAGRRSDPEQHDDAES